MKILLQRSWNFYKSSYGTLSLFVYRKDKLPHHKILFHWKSLPSSETDFRFDMLRKLKIHPSKHFINSCIYRLWSEYPKGRKIVSITKWERFVATTAVIYMRYRYRI